MPLLPVATDRLIAQLARTYVTSLPSYKSALMPDDGGETMSPEALTDANNHTVSLVNSLVTK